MSVKLRTTLVTALLLLLLAVVVSVYTLRVQQAELYRESVKRVELALSMLSEMAGPPLSQGDILGLAYVVDRAARGQPDRIMVADTHGVILADSKHELYNRTVPVLRVAARTQKAYVVRRGGLWEGADLVRDYRGRPSGIVYVAFSARPMDDANALVARQVALFALCLTAFGAIVAYLLGFYFSKAFNPLLVAIRRATGGDFETTVPRTGIREMDEIGQAFDKMTSLVGNEVRNLGLLNRLAAELTAATTLGQFAELLQKACRTLVDGNASLLSGDPRMGVLELVGEPSRKCAIRTEHAAFLAVNERRPVSIGQDSEHPSGMQVADGIAFASAVVAPLITPDRAAVGVIAVELSPEDHPSPDRQDETTVMAVANLAAPILATLTRAWTQQEAATALAEILLPEQVPQPEGMDIYGISVPADVSSGLGGDYYDVLALDEGLWGIAIGDVSGKGLEAGRYTAMTKYVVRSFALEHGPAGETVSRADAALSAQMEEMRFVTLFYCIVDLKARELTYCCAGHLPGLLHRLASDEVIELGVGGGVVGCTACGGDRSYGQETVALQPGDTLLLYTDGATEARHNHDEYGLDRLKAAIQSNARRSLKNLAKAITDDVRVFAGNVLRDDLTLVLLRLTEPPEAPKPDGGQV